MSVEALQQRFLQTAKNDSETAIREMNITVREGSVDFDTIFVSYLYFDKQINRETACPDYPGAPVQKGANDKIYYKVGFQVIVRNLDQAVDDVVFRRNDRDGYEILCKVTYAKQNAAKGLPNAGTYVQTIIGDPTLTSHEYTQDCARRFVDQDGNLLSHIWLPIQEQSIMKTYLWAYTPQKLAVFERLDKDTGIVQLRETVSVQLDDLKGSAYVYAYKKAVQKMNDKGEMEDVPGQFSTQLGYNFSLKCSAVSIINPEKSRLQSPADRMHEMFTKDEHTCLPYSEIKNGDAHMAQMSYFWVQDNFVTPKLARVILPAPDKSMYLINHDKADKQTVIIHTTVLKDFYIISGEGEEPQTQQYVIKLKIGDTECNSFGLRTDDPERWAAIHSAHSIHFHALASYWSTNSTSTRLNNASLANGSSETDGHYAFYVKRCVPDYKSYLPIGGIPITKERFIQDFEDANEDRDDPFFEINVGRKDKKEKYVFHTPCPWANPLHILGTKSPVINFGSGEYPMFACKDASKILIAKSASFYALCSISLEQAKEKYPKLKGDALFDKCKNDLTPFYYSLMVIQDLDENGQPSGSKKTPKKKKAKK